MNSKTFSLIAGVVFSLIVVAHATRLVMGWDATIGGWAAPRWLYVAELCVVVVLGWTGIRVGLNKTYDQA